MQAAAQVMQLAQLGDQAGSLGQRLGLAQRVKGTVEIVRHSHAHDQAEPGPALLLRLRAP